ncbi:hypothetical protein BA196_15245 [Klebsiella pneumoniae]|nr:hypothetical protein BA196_15245 [Klebsiella pneumoniae]
MQLKVIQWGLQCLVQCLVVHLLLELVQEHLLELVPHQLQLELLSKITDIVTRDNYQQTFQLTLDKE